MSSASPSSWNREIRAVFRKELLSELRTKTGLSTVGLFSLVAVVAITFGAYGTTLRGTLAAGLLWVTLLFASVIAMPRALVVEEEQGTADLLRLLARPHSVFWGKALYNLGLMLLTGVVLSVLFLTMVGTSVVDLPLYAVCLVAGCASLAGAGTLCGALVAQAANRTALAGAIAIPLLLPLVSLGVAGMRVALGEGLPETGWPSALGLVSYSVATLALGPPLFAAIWKN